jgi:hypothetical protein
MRKSSGRIRGKSVCGERLVEMSSCLDGCFMALVVLFMVVVIGSVVGSPLFWALLALILLIFFSLRQNSQED